MIESTLRARDIMTEKVHTLRPDARLSAANRELLASGLWGAPVVDAEGRVIGVISLSDISQAVAAGAPRWPRGSYYADLPADAIHELSSRGALSEIGGDAAKRLESTRVLDAMHRQIFATSPDALIDAVARTLLEHRIHRLLVLDDDELLGIVTSQDFVKLFVKDGA